MAAGCSHAEDCLCEKGITKGKGIHAFGLVTILPRAVKCCLFFFSFFPLPGNMVCSKNKILQTEEAARKVKE